MDDTLKRLMEICAEAGIESKSGIAHAFNVLPQHVNNWAKSGVPLHVMIKAQEVFSVNASWLVAGKGHKYLRDPISIKTESRDITTEVIDMLSDFDVDDADLWLATVKANANKKRRTFKE